MGLTPVLQKGQDRFWQDTFDLLVDDDDKEKSAIDPVIQNKQGRFDLLVVDDKRDKVVCVYDLQKKKGYT